MAEEIIKTNELILEAGGIKVEPFLDASEPVGVPPELMIARRLAARSVASKHWRLMPGMSYRFRQWDSSYPAWCRVPDDETARQVGSYAGSLAAVPNLDDPATLGCLLALVREAWGKPRAYVEPIEGRWRVMIMTEWLWGSTEAEALVAALEAAP